MSITDNKFTLEDLVDHQNKFETRILDRLDYMYVDLCNKIEDELESKLMDYKELPVNDYRLLEKLDNDVRDMVQAWKNSTRSR